MNSKNEASVLGVDLGEVLPRRKIPLDDLAGRSLAVDGYNTLYQFLAIIRQPDGTPLMDRQRRVTSHLSGILYRTANLAEKGIRVAYVFDGQPPELKEMEIKRRRKIREQAAVKYETALKAGSIEEARKYAQAAATVKELMVEDSKRLLQALGLPWVQAPSEGEAQAAHMAERGDVWAAASQDHDSLLFGAPRVVRNLTISGRRKLPGRQAYVEVEPEVVDLNETLTGLGVTRQQLVEVGILVGTDYNPDGIKGVGPKTALKLIKEFGDLATVTARTPEFSLPENVDKIKEFFLKPDVRSDYSLSWGKPNVDEVVGFLCKERDFSEDRVRKALEKMEEGLARPSTSPTLERFFG
jgi:flap endonuclease-1